MLPGPLLAVLWAAVAWALPAAQSLRALRLKSPERTVWLFYWLCYATCLWMPCYVEGVVRLPFYVLGMVLVDVYHEARLAVVFCLVCPRWRGLARLRCELGAAAPRLLRRALGRALGDALLAALQGGLARGEDGLPGPGVYTVIKEAGVMPTMETLKGHVVDIVKVGDTVEVLEVVRNAEEQRLRARIAPSGDRAAGWISLHSEKTGTWWVERGARPLGLLGGSSASEVFAHASAAGCNLAALWTGGAGAPDAAREVSDEDAWEAMAMLESQLSRADDPSDAGAMAASMLKQMLTGVVQMDNPDALGGVQAMVPELGKIWANQSTKAYLRELLAAQRQEGGFLAAQQRGAPAGASAGSSGGSGAPSSGASGVTAGGGGSSSAAAASGGAAGGSSGGAAGGSGSAAASGGAAGSAAASGGAASGSASGSGCLEREAAPSGSASGSGGGGGAPGAAAGGAS